MTPLPLTPGTPAAPTTPGRTILAWVEDPHLLAGEYSWWILYSAHDDGVIRWFDEHGDPCFATIGAWAELPGDVTR